MGTAAERRGYDETGAEDFTENWRHQSEALTIRFPASIWRKQIGCEGRERKEESAGGEGERSEGREFESCEEAIYRKMRGRKRRKNEKWRVEKKRGKCKRGIGMGIKWRWGRERGRTVIGRVRFRWIIHNPPIPFGLSWFRHNSQVERNKQIKGFEDIQYSFPKNTNSCSIIALGCWKFRRWLQGLILKQCKRLSSQKC